MHTITIYVEDSSGTQLRPVEYQYPGEWSEITPEQFKAQHGDIRENMAELFQDKGGSRASRELRNAQNDSFNVANTFFNNDELRKKFNSVARDLKGVPNRQKEQEALAMLSPSLRQAYNSPTMDAKEKRQFWAQADRLTRDPMTKGTATQFMALEMNQVTRENVEHSFNQARDINKPGDDKLADHKRQKNREEKEKKIEAANKVKERNQKVREGLQSGKQTVDNLTKNAADDLKMDVR